MPLKPVRPLALIALLVGLFSGTATAQARLYVFYPSLVRPIAIQEALARKCPELVVTVFGRLTDFQAKVASDSPEALLAQPAVLRQYVPYAQRLQGLRKGSPTEPYVLLSIDKPVDPAKMEGVTLGVVGLLERKPMADFVQGLVVGTPRLDRVTKVEDLLPLLTFRTVSAVLVSEPVAKEFHRKSQVNLVSARLDAAKVGLVSLAVRKAGTAVPVESQIVKAIQGLEAAELELLGVDAWK